MIDRRDEQVHSSSGDSGELENGPPPECDQRLYARYLRFRRVGRLVLAQVRQKALWLKARQCVLDALGEAHQDIPVEKYVEHRRTIEIIDELLLDDLPSFDSPAVSSSPAELPPDSAEPPCASVPQQVVHRDPTRGNSPKSSTIGRRSELKREMVRGVFLDALASGTGPPTQDEIARRVGCSRGWVSRSLKGWLTKYACYRAEDAKRRYPSEA